MEGLIIAFSTYSRIPMPRVDFDDDNMKYTICFFPLVGIAIGGLSWIFMAAAEFFGIGEILRAVVLTLVPLVVTGGIHLDGLLDTADAVSSWQTREKRLEIMKDSHCGAFSVIWCGAYYLACYGVMSQIYLSDMPQLMLIYVISRILSAIALLSFPKAKKSGLLRTFSDKAVNKKGRWILMIELCAACVILLSAGLLSGGIILLCGAICFLFYYRLTKKTFGGITGDLAGCFLCIAELAMTAAAALA